MERVHKGGGRIKKRAIDRGRRQAHVLSPFLNSRTDKSHPGGTIACAKCGVLDWQANSVLRNCYVRDGRRLAHRSHRHYLCVRHASVRVCVSACRCAGLCACLHVGAYMRTCLCVCVYVCTSKVKKRAKGHMYLPVTILRRLHWLPGVDALPLLGSRFAVKIKQMRCIGNVTMTAISVAVEIRNPGICHDLVFRYQWKCVCVLCVEIPRVGIDRITVNGAYLRHSMLSIGTTHRT